MCLAVPLEIVEIDGQWAKVKMGQGSIKVNVSLVPDAKVGDYAIVHAGFAIGKMDFEQAQETLDLVSQVYAQPLSK